MKLANILLVEDCDADAAFFMDFLERQRICNRVTRVVSYQDAWLHIQSGEIFDLLVVDIRIPGNGGLDVVKRAMEFPGYQKAKVIITSGMEHSEDVKAAAALDVVAYIVKPITEEKWEAAIAELKEVYKGYMVRAA
jgi:CheY-like chemotaxis protein